MDILSAIFAGFGIIVVIGSAGALIYGIYSCIKNKRNRQLDIQEKHLLGSGSTV